MDMNQNQGYQAPPSQPTNQYEPMTLGQWMITMLIMCIPVVGLIMLFVWAFSGNVNPSKKTYAQAALIWSVIITILSFALSTVIFSMLATLLSGYTL